MCRQNASINCPIGYLNLPACSDQAIVTPCEALDDDELVQMELDIVEFKTENAVSNNE